MSENKTILITGASTGIGRSTAERFQAEGWNVVATMRTPDNGADLAELDNVLVTRLDVTDSASIEAAVAAGIERFGAIDVLLNNAGFGAYGPLEATTMETVRRQFDTNVVGLLETTKAVLPHFRGRGSGVIINVSSVGGKVTFPLGTLYHGTKWAVEGLSEALSYELKAIGVKMKIVEPGGVATDFAGRSFTFSHDPSLEEYAPFVDVLVQATQNADAASDDDASEGGALAASPPSDVANVIFTAATDGTDQLRYISGADAEQMISMRESLNDDAAFMNGVLANFGLAEV